MALKRSLLSECCLQTQWLLCCPVPPLAWRRRGNASAPGCLTSLPATTHLRGVLQSPGVAQGGCQHWWHAARSPGKSQGKRCGGVGRGVAAAAARGVGRLPAYRRRTAPRQLPAAGLCACAQDLPPWVRREKERELQVRPLPAAQPPATPATRIGLISAPACTARTAQPAACAAACRPSALTVHARAARAPAQAAQAAKGGLPWGLSLLFSVFTTIAATGSIFEYVDRNPVFGILQVGQGQAGAGGVGARTDAAHATSPRSARAPAHCQPRLGCAHPPADAA